MVVTQLAETLGQAHYLQSLIIKLYIFLFGYDIVCFNHPQLLVDSNNSDEKFPE